MKRILICSLMCAAVTAHASDGTWNGSVGGNAGPADVGRNWSATSNWVGSIVGGTVGTTTSPDTLFMSTAGHYTITLDNNYNIKNAWHNSNPHRHAIVQTNGTSVLSLTSGGSITGNGNVMYYTPIRLEGGSGGSYALAVAGPLMIYGPMVGTATAGGNYTLILSGLSANESDFTFSGSYVGSLADGSGGGSLSVLQTNGFWNMNSANSYSGPTTVRNGHMKFGNAVSPFGTNIIVLGDSGTVSGDSIELEHANNGTLNCNIIVNSNNVTGTTMISVRNNLGTPTFGGTITLSRTITVYAVNSGTPTFTGVISGPGGIIKSGVNFARLQNANTYTGDTTMSDGELRLKHVNAIQNSTLDMGVAGSQFVTFDLSGNNIYNLGGLKGTNNLAIGGNTISVGANNKTTTYYGVISGAGGAFTKVGTGILTVNTNTYSGATTVSAGTLLINGWLSTTTSTVTVSANGTLGGTGTIQRAVSVQSGGTLRGGIPGAVGTLTIVSNVTMAANTQVACDLANGAMSTINILGSLTLPTAGTVTVTRGTGRLISGPTALITASGNITCPSISGWTVLPAGGYTLSLTTTQFLLQPRSGFVFMVD